MNNKCNLDYKRVLNKGKSFECSKWQQFVTYTNDFTKQDFVISDGALFVCMQTHMSSEDNKPKLVYGDPTNPHKPTGVNSSYWEYVLYGPSEGSTISKQFNKVPIEWTDGYYFNITPGETFSYNLVESSDYQSALLIPINKNERWKISTKIENICNWAILDASWKCIRVGKREGICEDIIDIKDGEHFLCINNLKSYSNAHVLKEQFLNITIDEILETLHNTATKKNVEDVKQDMSDLRDNVIKELADITHDISNISSADDIYKANNNAVQTYAEYIDHKLNSTLSSKFDNTKKYFAINVEAGDVLIINTKYNSHNVVGIYDKNNICVRIIESTNPDIYKTTVLIQNNETQVIVNCNEDYNGYITKLNLPKLNEKSIKQINSILEDKVDKIPGKTLTSNDYTSDDKEIVSLARNFLQEGFSNTLDLNSSKPITSRAVYNLFSNEIFYPGVVNFSIGTTPSVMESQDYENCFVVVQPGDRFFINAISGNDVYTWGLFDTGWNCVRTGNGNINEIIQVQEGELILYVNNLLTNRNKGVVKINAYEQTIDEIRRDLNNKANLDQDGKIATYQLPDYIFGQLLFGGTVTSWTTDTITISPSNKFISKFELPYDTTSYQIYKDSVWLYEGVYFIIPSEENSTIFDHVVNKGDWIVSTGNEWVKIDNSDPSFDEIIETLNAKADSTGNYPEMSVGSAHDLTGRIEATPEEFKYRPSAGEKSIRDDSATIKRIKGSSLVWNSIARTLEEIAYRKRNFFNYDAATNTFSTKEENPPSNLALELLAYNAKPIIGHKYLVAINGEYSNNAVVHFGSATYTPKISPEAPQIVECTKSGYFYFFPFGTTSTNLPAGTSFTVNSVFICDLTQMFGSGNEPTTVDEFYARIPEGIDINAYNEGELINFTAESIKTTGFNQWDEQWEVGYIDASGNPVDRTSNIRSSNFIPVIGGATYYSKGGDCIIVCYDENKKFIPYNGETGAPVYTNCINIVNTTFVLPINTRYIKFWMAKTYGATYNNDICINLSHSGVRDGEYEPYKEFTYDLSWIKKYFPNGMRSAGSVYDEIQYNESTQQWVAIKRIGEVDLGSLDWDVSNTGEMVVSLDTAKKPAQGLCLKYNFEKTNSGNAENDKSFVLNTNAYNLRILDSDYTDAESFKEAMSGVKLYYELAEPVVTTITEILDTNYSVFDFGTEEILLGTTTINNEETGETNTVTIPSTSFKGNIVYAFNAVDRIRDNSRNIEKLNEKTLNKVDKENGKGLSTNDYTNEDKEQVAKIGGKQDTLTLTVKDNGNIVIGNIAVQTKEFMPATPSGDPMHYYYLSHFGVTYNESTGFFELEYLKNLTANDMRNAVRVSGDTRWLYNDASSVSALVALEDRPRTNIAMLSGTIQVSDRYNVPRWCRALEQWIIGKCSASSVATLTNIYDGNNGVKFALVGLAELRYIVGVINISTLASRRLSEVLGESTLKLQEVRLEGLKTSQTIKVQKNLSKDSITYLLSNRINTEDISLSLPAELYNKIMTDGGEWADLRSLCEATTDKGKVILELNA